MAAKRAENLIGRRFGRLLVIEEAGKTEYGNMIWLCKCDCGNECLRKASVLKRGVSNSCGCIRRERGKETIKNAWLKVQESSEHVKKERLYKVWHSMVSRCAYKTGKSYKNYGGRGISVCDEWRNSYKEFRKWALENGYDETAKRGQCTIDRINNDGNYEPTNCRWVSMKVQAANKRRTVKKHDTTM